MSISNKLFAAALSALLLAGCGNMAPMEEGVKRTTETAKSSLDRMDEYRKTGAVTRMPAAKLAGDEVYVRAINKLPSVFLSSFSYLSVPQPLADILGEIGRRTGYSVAIQADAPAAMGGMPMGMPQQQQGGVSPQQPGMLAIDWRGDLKGLLDHLAMRTGKHWKLDDGRIYFYKTETRTFHVHLPQGKKTITANIGLSGVQGGSGSSSATAPSGGGGGGSTGGTVNVSSSTEIDAYEAIRQSLNAILSDSSSSSANSGGIPMPGGMPGGMPPSSGGAGTASNVTVNASLGLITVTTNPVSMERVENYVRNVNEKFAQNVMIGVKVYNVTVKRGVNAGASLMLAYQNAAGRYGMNITGAPMLTPTIGAPGTLILDYTSPTSRLLGSQIALQALEQVGDVSLRTSGQVIAANGQPTPLQVATDITYLASSSIIAGTATSPPVTTLVPGTKTVGFTANFLPLILGDNRILLQYQINLSSLLSMNQITSGGSSIQTPNIANQSLQQQAYVRDGQTIVLFGFEQERDSVDRANGLTGISRNADKDRTMMVIVMEVHGGK